MCRAALEALKRDFRNQLRNKANPYPMMEELFRDMDIEQEQRENAAAYAETQRAEIRRLEAAVEDGSRMIDRLNRARIRYLKSLFGTATGKFCYVSVLVDANHMHFLNDLVRKGVDGGAEAAPLLAQDVQNYLGGIDPKAVQDTSCRILVCANVGQLEPLYSTSRTIEFIQGFNSNPLANFVDVGGQAAWNDFGNHHCRHVVFCGSGNDNHAAILWRFKRAPAISLVEGRPFPPGMSTVARAFKTVKFNEVFMSPGFLPPETPTSGKGQPDPVDRVGEHLRVHLNRNGQRVDSRIAYSARDTLNLLMRVDERFQRRATAIRRALPAFPLPILIAELGDDACRKSLRTRHAITKLGKGPFADSLDGSGHGLFVGHFPLE
ncbi:hypothetical protein BJX66DRAFT_343680 [Aspergillus keveii]|uniref:DUF7923 domain-containing protein n=1 Tax=Aspergillus keveii TaxID=714993 RepID=A0ABR4FNF8_9EURO